MAMVDFADTSEPTARPPTIRKANRQERIAASGLLWGCVSVCAFALLVAALALVRLLLWLWIW